MKGSCLCGAVRYDAGHVRPTVTACHCSQCRKASGMFWASTTAMLDDIAISGPVKRFRSSDIAERGFCAECGSALFYRPLGGDHVAVSAGSADDPTGLALTKHIFTGHKCDYYEITDDLPQREN